MSIKYSDLREGDKVVATFDNHGVCEGKCWDKGQMFDIRVVQHGLKAIQCHRGMHYLDTQTDEKGFLIGFVTEDEAKKEGLS